MNFEKVSLAPGLYFVGVPIGTARDITLRALDVLASADVLAAEDSRSLRHLMEIHAVPLNGRKIVAMHDHSRPGTAERLVDEVARGRSVAYASEAGMPGIADPGFELARAAQAAGVMVTCAPGPSAVTTALLLGGLPTDAFHFAGFLPSARGARRTALAGLAEIPATLVLYESPKRLGALLADAAELLGGDRQARVCRELTKRFEEVVAGTVDELATRFADETPKGEIVVLLNRPARRSVDPHEVDVRLKDALKEMSVRDAAAQVAADTGMKKRDLYQRALEMSKDEAADQIPALEKPRD